MMRLLRWLLDAPPDRYWCPWCGHRARLNTESPLTIACDHCETCTQIGAIT